MRNTSVRLKSSPVSWFSSAAVPFFSFFLIQQIGLLAYSQCNHMPDQSVLCRSHFLMDTDVQIYIYIFLLTKCLGSILFSSFFLRLVLFFQNKSPSVGKITSIEWTLFISQVRGIRILSFDEIPN